MDSLSRDVAAYTVPYSLHCPVSEGLRLAPLDAVSGHFLGDHSPLWRAGRKCDGQGGVSGIQPAIGIRLLAGTPLFAFGDDAPEEFVFHAASVGRTLANAPAYFRRWRFLAHDRPVTDLRPTHDRPMSDL